MILVGIDPGSVHCGLVVFKAPYSEHPLEPFYHQELTPEELFLFLRTLAGADVFVAYESFHLYAGRAVHKTFSSFPEVEVIGVIKYICEQLGFSYCDVLPSAHKQHHYDRKFESGHVKDAYSIAMYALKFNPEIKAWLLQHPPSTQAKYPQDKL